MDSIPRVRFINSIFGLVTQPSQTCQRLFRQDFPPFIISFAICILLTIFVPIVTQVVYLDLLAYNSTILVSVSVVVFFTLATFTVIELVFLQLLGIEILLEQIIAAIIYSSVPLMVMLWVLYGYNHYQYGSITLITQLLTGYRQLPRDLESILPYFVLVTHLQGIWVFRCCLKQIGGLQSATAFLVTVVSVVPFYICFLIALALSEYAAPGTIKIIVNVVPWARYMLN